jgi:hypothetical protein
MSHEAFDGIVVRCPKLGGEVEFGYCRQVEQGLPCARALTCFQLLFPVARYFELVLKKETFQRCFSAPPEPKLDSLLKAVERAKTSLDGNTD